MAANQHSGFDLGKFDPTEIRNNVFGFFKKLKQSVGKKETEENILLGSGRVIFSFTIRKKESKETTPQTEKTLEETEEISVGEQNSTIIDNKQNSIIVESRHLNSGFHVKMLVKEAGLFASKYETIQKEIPFKETWLDENGSLKEIIKDYSVIDLTSGQLRKSVTTDGRKIIIVGTEFGSVIVYQLEKDTVSRYPNIGYVAPEIFRKLGWIRKEGRVDYADLCILIGSETDKGNIGKATAELAAQFRQIYGKESK